MEDEDPKKVYLSCRCCGDGFGGREWSEDKEVFDCLVQEPVEYIRADLVLKYKKDVPT